MELLARQIIDKLEDHHVEGEELEPYMDPESPQYESMVEEIRKQQGFTTLRYNRLDDMLDAVGLPKENLCTYCWNGKE